MAKKKRTAVAKIDALDALDEPTRALVAPSGSGKNAALVYFSRLKPSTRATMRTCLDRIAKIVSSGEIADATAIDWSRIRPEHSNAIRARLEEQFKPNTANLTLAALRGVLKETWRLGQITSEELARATDFPSVRGSSLPKGRDLDGGELRRLVETCKADDSPAGARDAAALAVLYGARRAEVAGLRIEDWDAKKKTLRITGKGAKERRVPYSNGQQAAIEHWIEVRGNRPGFLFVSINRWGQFGDFEKPLSGQAILDLVQKRATEAGLGVVKPHDLRRTACGDMLPVMDVGIVSGLLGHSDPATSLRYDRRSDEEKASAVRQIFFPF